VAVQGDSVYTSKGILVCVFLVVVFLKMLYPIAICSLFVFSVKRSAWSLNPTDLGYCGTKNRNQLIRVILTDDDFLSEVKSTV